MYCRRVVSLPLFRGFPRHLLFAGGGALWLRHARGSSPALFGPGRARRRNLIRLLHPVSDWRFDFVAMANLDQVSGLRLRGGYRAPYLRSLERTRQENAHLEELL